MENGGGREREKMNETTSLDIFLNCRNKGFLKNNRNIDRARKDARACVYMYEGLCVIGYKFSINNVKRYILHIIYEIALYYAEVNHNPIRN